MISVEEFLEHGIPLAISVGSRRFFGAGVPAPCHADPIFLTGGFVNFFSDFSPFMLTGEGLIIRGVTKGDAFVPPQGGLLDLSGEAFLQEDFPSHHPVQKVVNGTSYMAFLSGSLTFTSEPFVIPTPDPGRSGLH